MGKINLFLTLALAASLTACSSSDDGTTTPPTPTPQSNVVNFAPTRQTKIAFTSNNVDVAQNAIVTWTQVKDTTIDQEAEDAAVKKILTEQKNNTEQIKTDFLYYAKDGDVEFELYPVSTNTNQTHFVGIFYYDEQGVKHEQIVWENFSSRWNFIETQYWPKKMYTTTGLKVTVKKGYKFGFYWSGKYLPEGQYNDVATTFYSSTAMNPDGKAHAGTFVQNGKTYLGMEDWTDYDYQDMVFMCNKQLSTVPADDITPTNPDKPNVPDTPAEDPEDPEIKAMGGSVEVNLALNAEHEKDDWKESHLSVHVRDTTDFTLFIPVEAEYYCPQDDMMIVQKHDTQYVYNSTNETLSMDINGNTVTLDVTFAENGITFTSHGINAEVLKYLRDTYGDGLTFEVRNYYNDALSRAQLQEKLNKSTISFTNAPDVYYYAYGIWEGEIDPLACIVKPTDAADREPENVFTGATNSAVLHVYKKK